MQKGDKFIVVDNKTTAYETGEIVNYICQDSLYPELVWVYSSDGLKQCIDIDQLNPLDRFPCDDEQYEL